MIGKVTRGVRAAGLIYYLFGPGQANEHVDPRVVAGFRHPVALEPGARPGGTRDFRHLIAVLNHPLDALSGVSFDQSVWHCSVRAAPTDRILSDAEWADVAEEVLHRTGIAPREDDQGCRWVAVRHADDHIHIVAVLAREDGRRPRLWHDHLRVREACRAVGEAFGLRSTAPADRTAAPRPTRAEKEQAARRGWPETPRTELRRTVTAVAAGTSSEREFFGRLEEIGVLVRKRYSVRTPGQVTGYAVALPDRRNRAGEPVWFSGGKLAPDLTIPKLHQRWISGPPGPRSPADASTERRTSRGRPGSWAARPDLSHDERSDLYRQAAQATARAVATFRATTDPGVRADIAAATADTLRTVAWLTGNRHLIRAADSYDRAAREPYGRTSTPTPDGYALRTVVRGLVWTMDPLTRRVHDTTLAMAGLVVSVIELIEAVAAYRRTQRRFAQADAARTAARTLRIVPRPGNEGSAHQTVQAPPVVTVAPDLEADPTQLAASDFPVPIFGGTPAAGPSGWRAEPSRPHNRVGRSSPRR